MSGGYFNVLNTIFLNCAFCTKNPLNFLLANIFSLIYNTVRVHENLFQSAVSAGNSNKTLLRKSLARDPKTRYNKGEDELLKQIDMLHLSSAKSFRISLEAVKYGMSGLNEHRMGLLSRVPNTNDWAKFPKESLTMKDIAFLTAKTGDEFAILRGKKEDILFHGSKYHCNFEGILYEMLIKRKLQIYGHSHPSEIIPIPSRDDRKTLKLIRQKKSRLISAVSGNEVEFDDDEFGNM